MKGNGTLFMMAGQDIFDHVEGFKTADQHDRNLDRLFYGPGGGTEIAFLLFGGYAGSGFGYGHGFEAEFFLWPG